MVRELLAISNGLQVTNGSERAVSVEVWVAPGVGTQKREWQERTLRQRAGNK